jgi:hypothetical protein
LALSAWRIAFLRAGLKRFQEANQHPVPMNRRMPVVTTIKRRVQLLWTLNIEGLFKRVPVYWAAHDYHFNQAQQNARRLSE